MDRNFDENHWIGTRLKLSVQSINFETEENLEILFEG